MTGDHAVVAVDDDRVDEAKLTKAEYKEYLKELKATDTLEIVENLKAENKQLSETVDMLTNCILEMSEIIYE